MLTIPLSSDARPLVYHSNYHAVSTAQFHRAFFSSPSMLYNRLLLASDILRIKVLLQLLFAFG